MSSELSITMASLEVRIAKHIIRLQKIKSRQTVEQQRNAYYTAPGPSLQLLNGQISSVSRDKRKETLVEKEVPETEPTCTRAEEGLQQPERPEENPRTLEEEDVQMRSGDKPGIYQVFLVEERVHGEVVEGRQEEENQTQQEELRRDGEEARRRYEEHRRRQEEEEERRCEELRRQEEEEARRRCEEQRRQEEEAQRQYEEQRRQEEERRDELRRQEEEARRQQDNEAPSQNSKAQRFHPYARGADNQRRNEV